MNILHISNMLSDTQSDTKQDKACTYITALRQHCKGNLGTFPIPTRLTGVL